MEDTTNTIYFFCTFLLCVCHLQYFCSGRNNITSGQWIHDNKGEGIVSPGNIFQLGFFTPNGITASRGVRYIGIWYCKSPEVIVWVANREVPIPINESGKFSIDARGSLKVCDLNNNCTYFFTPPIDSPKSHTYSAKLYDTGNLVLADALHVTMWESFKYPTDTFLPGMKMNENLTLTSWISAENPAPGNFSFGLDKGVIGGYFITKLGMQHYWTSWGKSEENFIQKDISFPPAARLLNNTINTSREVNNSRLWIRPDGEIQYWSWDSKKTRWLVSWSEPEEPCSFYNACGPFGSCNPEYSHNLSSGVCTCLPGFEPTNKKDWNLNKFSEGCKKIPSICTNTTGSFVKLYVTMVRSNKPHLVESNFSDEDVDIESCRSRCQNNCSCQAYSVTIVETINKRKSLECWFWNDVDLYDIQEASTLAEHGVFFRKDFPGTYFYLTI